MKKIRGVLLAIIMMMVIGIVIKQNYPFLGQDQKMGEIAQQKEQDNTLNKLYSLQDVDYQLYQSQLVDTYMIACALYFDFDSNYIMPGTEQDDFYQEVRAYFKPYRNHPFIMNLGKYVDEEAKDIHHGVVYPLLMYELSEQYYGMGVDQIQTNVFENGEAFLSFLDALKTFYSETQAETFFRSHHMDTDMASYISATIDQTLTRNLFKEMEKEVGKSTQSPIHYVGILSLFRPNMGSAYQMNMGSDTYFVLQASPNGRDRKPKTYDMKMLLNTTIHELLHLYLNDEVAALQDQIDNLAQGKVKEEYASDLYTGMPWYRIVDENLVRAVETYLYAQCYNNEEQAYEEILQPEIQAGFSHVEALYDAVKTCKENESVKIADCSYLLFKAFFR